MTRAHVALLLFCAGSCDAPSSSDGSRAASANAGAPQQGSVSSSASAPPLGSVLSSATAPPSLASATTPYSGPTGTLSGTIRVTGDPPPDTPHSYPKECGTGGQAAAMYGKLFRVGQDRALADAIVGVTKYQGFVAPKSDLVSVSIKRCSYSTRSIAMSDGQRLEIRNLDEDTTSYLPWLDGARLPAGVVATPRGDAVKLYTRGYGRYWLRDQLARTFMVAHVFHLHYATTAVTGLDGKYRIEGIPVGKVDVGAMLPQAVVGTPDGKKPADPTPLHTEVSAFEIKPGDNSLDLEIKFDAKKNVPIKPEAALSDSKAD